ncbi:MAG: DUF3841 domain-containing protein [Oscillospiraceae bacterium]|nr:DUF3841 domain-containing protein [Oscillospiraceae bacterium]
METVTAWTRQHETVWHQLEKTGVYRVREENIREKNGPISEYYLEMYRWYAREASARVPRPAGAEYPIWLFLDETARLTPLEGSVQLTLEIPADQLVITDSERWGYRINYMYVPRDREDLRRHNEELETLGIGNETALVMTSLGNHYPLMKQKILRSWPRVFEEPPEGFTARQATVWELRREWVRDVEYGQPV